MAKKVVPMGSAGPPYCEVDVQNGMVVITPIAHPGVPLLFSWRGAATLVRHIEDLVRENEVLHHSGHRVPVRLPLPRR